MQISSQCQCSITSMKKTERYFLCNSPTPRFSGDQSFRTFFPQRLHDIIFLRYGRTEQVLNLDRKILAQNCPCLGIKEVVPNEEEEMGREHSDSSGTDIDAEEEYSVTHSAMGMNERVSQIEMEPIPSTRQIEAGDHTGDENISNHGVKRTLSVTDVHPVAMPNVKGYPNNNPNDI